MSLGAYEWLVLLHVGLSTSVLLLQFLMQEWFRESHSELMAVQLVNYIISGCGLELILAVYREVHAQYSFALKRLSIGTYMYNILAP